MSEKTKTIKKSEKPEKIKPKSQAGKGPEWRKGTNFQRYWNSPFWNTLEKNEKEMHTKSQRNKDHTH